MARVLLGAADKTARMQRTRNEISALLKKSEQNLKKTEDLHRQLQALMIYVDRVLAKKLPARRKSQK